MKLSFFAILVFLLIQDGQSTMTAVALVHVDSSITPTGTILFYQRDTNSPVRVVGILNGLKSNTVHGFHVHRDPLINGELNCTAAGPHFNPYGTLHGPREADLKHRHVGDLGNLTANDNGIIIVELSDSIIDLYNVTRSIANRTIVLHAMRDDGGKGGFPDSNTTGNAGARIACGVISLPMKESDTKSHSSKSSTMITDFFRKLFD
ncbi:unnamed protein product [Rotaria sp. Silwood1]|nr:unnamed protein product [Rotaria sp. Silwood1]CAF1587834.1 unnamed protein product [Rotaria sp. Silwood1]CAF3675324.1 unnamed protein product [Rotaria sp. Silwood1]CAF3764853.1 unnamed protein product [Rotaria sp. Silwood1]CAF4627505.1 unnamed protein product [Rotaria sp. Silwood1]